jgi:hypothetical protein
VRIATAIRQLLSDVLEATSLPSVRVNLMADAATANDPFFLKCVHEHYRDARRRHRKFLLIRNLEYGVAVCVLPANHELYMKGIEASARRNIKKALRLGYQFERIDPNKWLNDMADIHRSTDVRQGPMRPELLDDLRPISDPPSRTNLHDYPYFGVLKNGHCVAYAGCLVAGEMVSVGNIFGHDAVKGDGVVPLLISEIVRYTYDTYPAARYFIYDKYFGAGETLRRFKKKFGFLPHRVSWSL